MKLTKKTIFISLFAILYLCVGLVSTIHAVSFFGLANAPILGIILAITFEIGQAAVLFNLLTSPNQRKKFMPWALMCILTAVQVLGNIFSSYKYLISNSSDDLRFFKEPIFVWTDLPDQQCNVIITYIVGAILPIVALCLTEMVTSYLYSEDNEPKINNIKTPQETLDELIAMTDENGNPYFNHDFLTQKFGIPQIQTNEVEEQINEQEVKEQISEQKVEEQEVKNDTKEISEDSKLAANELMSGKVLDQSTNKEKKESHFINI